jgi:hypothetical protein
VSVTTSAPALISGFRGTPFSASSWTMELNGEPEGSRPTRVHKSAPERFSAMVSVKTLEMLWIENGTFASPASAVSPSSAATAMPNFAGSTRASAGM